MGDGRWEMGDGGWGMGELFAVLHFALLTFCGFAVDQMDLGRDFDHTRADLLVGGLCFCYGLIRGGDFERLRRSICGGLQRHR